MKTAKEILMQKATENKDGFLSGQIKWIVEAMEEYAKQYQQEEDNGCCFTCGKLMDEMEHNYGTEDILTCLHCYTEAQAEKA